MCPNLTDASFLHDSLRDKKIMNREGLKFQKNAVPIGCHRLISENRGNFLMDSISYLWSITVSSLGPQIMKETSGENPKGNKEIWESREMS